MIFLQKPTEKLLYEQRIEGDTVSSATWSIAPTGPTLTPQTPSGSIATVLVAGVTNGILYKLAVHIVAAGGQEFDGCAFIKGNPCLSA